MKRRSAHAKTPMSSKKKRIILFSALGCAILAILVYILSSYFAWNTAAERSASINNELKTTITSQLAGETPPTSLITSVDKALETTLNAHEPCKLSWLFEWQTSLWYGASLREQCLSSSSTGQSVRRELETFQAYLRDEAAFAVALKHIATPSSITYEQSAEAWKTYAETLKGNPLLGNAPEATKSAALAIAAGYTALNAATTNEDKAAFDTAEAAIIAGYASLNPVKETFETLRTEHIATLVSAFKTL